MSKRLVVIAALVAMILGLALCQAGEQAWAKEINVLPYYGANNFKVGDYWTYAYDEPPGAPDFTVAVTEVTSGPFAGDYRLGNYEIIGRGTDWRILNWDATGISVYETALEGVLCPPLKINAEQPQPLEELVNVPVYGSLNYDPINYWYYQKLSSSLTVPAGTFNDLLLNLVFDEHYGPNSANTYFGLDPATVPYAVTEANWSARGIGEIQVAEIDAESGELISLYQLKATNVPLPPSLVLLGSGLLGLWAARRRLSY
ncbi:MAG: hypothetical protein P8168_10410 [Deltaproteobacteria bacterium]